MTKQKESIGFIGLGIMGKKMAANLMQNGYELTVFNRSKKSVDELSSQGARAAASPKEVARNSDLVIDMVTDAPDVEQVLLGKNGVIEGAKKGLTVIDMSTNSPTVAKSIFSKLGESGIEFLDAPVTGGENGAKEGTLTIMVGGKKDVFQRCKPILEAMGKEIVYMGASGSGQATKLCNQAAVSIHTLATSEALLLGASCGLDLKDLLKVLTSGAAGSWNLSSLGPKIIQGDFEPGFKAAHLSKDLRYIMQLSEENRLMLPGSATVYQLYNSILAENKGEKGTQILAQVLEKLASRQIGTSSKAMPQKTVR
ncbi:MAG: NAD(P)-dependent oxidoreductase [Nitrososphaerales archaeon]